MTTLESLWQSLESAANGGLLYQRYPGIVPDVYAGIRPGNAGPERVLAIGLDAPFAPLPETLNGLNLRVERVADPLQPARQLLLLTLGNPALNDLFAVFSEDLIAQIGQQTAQEPMLTLLVDRLEHWRALFESYSPAGLSAEAQWGLFGELWFLRKRLTETTDATRCLTGWTGPTGAVHDFQWPTVAVEVKTSVAVNPQQFYVSNERQLDDAGLGHLILLFLALDAKPIARPDAGETLNDLADAVAHSLQSTPALLNQFRLRLYETGYFPEHRARYDQPGYTVRQSRWFRVGEGFPRLREADVPTGVGELRYAVSLAACGPFEVGENNVADWL